MKLTVLIPTYRRPKDLARCLTALTQQTRSPDEVLLVVRDSDAETWQFLQAFDTQRLPVKTVTVTVPGQVSALNVGLDAAIGDVISITDDDAAPHPDWLERIEAHFLADAQVGGVGGRDYVYHGDRLEDGAKLTVGKVNWFGHVTGNHHMGTGSARQVDVLKGANMSYRRTAIQTLQFDQRLLGSGAQIHNDMAFSLAVQRQGWKLLYDPAVAVDHFPAQRFDEDKRQSFSSVATSNAIYNETLILLSYLSPIQRWLYLLWASLIGTRSNFGLVQLVRFFPQEGSLALHRWQAACHGRWQAWKGWRQAITQNQQEGL